MADTANISGGEKPGQGGHSGHRQRMHERVEKYGIESLAEHEVLEYLLYFVNARRDTNGIAHELIKRFGDFAGVLEASEKELMEIDGVGPSAARLLHLLPEISSYYSRAKVRDKRSLNNSDKLGRYFLEKFALTDHERVLLLSLDKRRRVKAATWIGSGRINMVDLKVKDVVAAAIDGGTDTVVLAHNHPNGALFPSRSDLEVTADIMRALALVGVRLIDHFILTETEYFSMSDGNRMPVYDYGEGTLYWPRGSRD